MSEHILEYVEGQPTGRIDRAKAAIFGVKILGEMSRNPPPHNNFYGRDMRQRSAPLFEGMRVFVDHPGRSDAGETRPYQQAMGLLKNVREAGDGLRADWFFPPGHPVASNVLWDAEHASNNLAFSINATAGRIRMDGGRKVIESLEKVHSVDLVSRGATVKGLFESRRPARPPERPIKLTGIYAARLRAIDKATDQGKLTKALRESLCHSMTERQLEDLLERAGVIVVPSYVRSGADLARWCRT